MYTFLNYFSARCRKESFYLTLIILPIIKVLQKSCVYETVLDRRMGKKRTGNNRSILNALFQFLELGGGGGAGEEEHQRSRSLLGRQHNNSYIFFLQCTAKSYVANIPAMNLSFPWAHCRIGTPTK
jgi:hypothetical protein